MKFQDIIGQAQTKRKLGFYIDSYKRCRTMPHLMMIAEKGFGKTMFAQSVAESLGKPFHILNCSTLKSVKDFFETIVDKHMVAPSYWSKECFSTPNLKPCTIILDEASELPKDLTMALLTILNPNKEGKNTFIHGDVEYLFDFSVYTFLFATTEPQKVFHALMDRCERVDLQPYSVDDLAQIIAKNVVVPIQDKVLPQIASVLRGNPRAAQKMADTINTYVRANNFREVTEGTWKQLRSILGILPLGVNNTEFQILKTLSENTAVKVNQLAAKLGLTTSSIQRHFEHFLIRNQLIQINNSGRSLTEYGRQYMSSCL